MSSLKYVLDAIAKSVNFAKSANFCKFCVNRNLFIEVHSTVFKIIRLFLP